MLVVQMRQVSGIKVECVVWNVESHKTMCFVALHKYFPPTTCRAVQPVYLLLTGRCSMKLLPLCTMSANISGQQLCVTTSSSEPTVPHSSIIHSTKASTESCRTGTCWVFLVLLQRFYDVVFHQRTVSLLKRNK